MGVNPTPTNFKTFTFDGENSRNYGVYITGEGVFNAPERNVEMVDIPGRNGAFALDKGNFNNIEVTYPAGIFADTEADFAEAVSDLRNLLCSKVGYVRLEDDYNPNEYRLAIYKSGLDVDHDLLIAGEFELVFECKPQRYLKSGETAITVTSGNTITNPTRFDAQPQLQVWGYGDVQIGGKTVSVVSEYIGEVVASDKNRSVGSNVFGITTQINTQYANVGDSIRAVSSTSPFCAAQYYLCLEIDSGIYSTVGHSIGTGDADGFISGNSSNRVFITAFIKESSFAYGTSETKSGSINFSIYGTNYGTLTVSSTVSLAYDGNNELYFWESTTIPSHMSIVATGTIPFVETSEVYIDSTQTTLGNPVYIDLDIGEAYKIENDIAVSVNNGVIMPADLPTLSSGANTITYDNTFTQFKVVPRWWQV